MIRLATAFVVVLLCAAFGTAPAAGSGLFPATERRVVLGRVLPGEFERQDAIVVSWDSNDEVMQRAVVRIVGAAWKRVPFLVLVSSPEGQMTAMAALRQVGVPRTGVRYLMLPFDSVWTRDYGPVVVIGSDGSSELIDADYGHGDRVGDDAIPSAMGPLLGLPTRRAPLTVDGGNLLSNGEGLCLTSFALLEHNVDREYSTQDIENILRSYYGTQQVVFLEPLAGEPTGHVDMFAAFVDADTVVVGEFAPEVDPVNAEILDRNADRLAEVQTSNGPLNVVRIPMPPHQMDVWRTYTNVLFANGTLIVPSYPGVDPRGEAMALSIYRQLLPGWTVVAVDCNELIEWGGAIHCVTRNLARLPPQSGTSSRLLAGGPRQRFLPPRVIGREGPRERLNVSEPKPALRPKRDEGWQPVDRTDPRKLDRRRLFDDRERRSGRLPPVEESTFADDGAFPSSTDGFRRPVRRVRTAPMFLPDR